MKGKITILIGGEAGQGIAFTSFLLGKIFSKMGYFVFVYRDYPSLIRGGHNFNILTISKEPVFSYEQRYDVIIALDQKTIVLHENDLKEEGVILGDKKLKTSKKILEIDLQSILKEHNFPPIFGNNILLGYLFNYLGVEKDVWEKGIDQLASSQKELLKKSITIGYELREFSFSIPKNGKEKYFLTGNEAIGLGAVLSGVDIYFAYPMTPSTGVLHFLSPRQLKFDLIAFQLDDEIAVINAALGASFGGARVMVGTSGGGFALMTEGLSLAGMAELPLVIYLSQRPGPATGVPTYTSQGDLFFALNAGHGEFPKIVVAPGDAQEAILRVQQLFYLTERFRTPGIILGDKHLGESTFSFEQLPIFDLARKRFVLEKERKENYPLEERDGNYWRNIPGQSMFARVSSYEHDPLGITTEDPQMISLMTERRWQKQKAIKEEVEKMNPCQIFGEGENLIIAWGSTKGAILDSLKTLKEFRFLQISFLSPFPSERVREEIEKSKNVFVIENNISAPLARLIRQETGIFLKNKILKYDGRPFLPEEIIQKIKNG